MGDNIFDSVVHFSDNDKPYDAFEHLCRSVFSDYRKGGILAYLIVYSDASYNQPSGATSALPIHTIGAYVATDVNWRRFRKAWKSELDKKKLDHFHMTDFEYAQNAIITGKPLKADNPYCGWKRSDFVPFLRKLHRVINKKNSNGSFRMRSFIASVVKPDFDKTLPVELKDDPSCVSYYMFNAVNLMEQVAKWADENHYNDPIHYVFAGGDKEGANLENWFDYCWGSKSAQKRYRLSKGYSRIGYSIEWAQAEPALQAADIAAFEFNKLVVKATKNGSFEIDQNELRKSLLNLCNAKHSGILLTELLPTL